MSPFRTAKDFETITKHVFFFEIKLANIMVLGVLGQGPVSELPFEVTFLTGVGLKSNKYRVSSYKTLPQIIPAILIIPAFLILLCSENVVFSNKTRI